MAFEPSAVAESAPVLCPSCPFALPERERQRELALGLLRAMPEGAMLCVSEIAQSFALPFEAVRKRLERFRAESDDWEEVQNPRRNESRVVYRIGSIAHILRHMLSE